MKQNKHTASDIPVRCAFGAMEDITELQPNPRNPNKHGDKQIALLAKIIRHQGWRSPIVVSKRSGFIVSGHGRYEAAKLLQVEQVPVDKQDFATEADEWAHLVADNRIAELAEIDEKELVGLLKELDGKIDLDLSGFDQEGIAELGGLVEQTDVDAEPQIDRAAELQKEWKTARGQLWELGEHRLLCGNSTCKEDAERVMGGDLAEMMFADPPYGVEYVGKTKDALTISNDGAAGLPALLDGAFAQAMCATRAGAAWYVAAPPGPLHWEFARRLMDLGVYRQTLVWVKDSMVLGHSDYHYKHEPIFYGWKPGAAHREMRTRDQVSVWEIPRPKRSAEHPTMKPVELVRLAVENSSGSGDIVYEPFSGSGTTLIACEQLGRKCRAIEIDPGYVAVALQRFKDATGKQPRLING